MSANGTLLVLLDVYIVFFLKFLFGSLARAGNKGVNWNSISCTASPIDFLSPVRRFDTNNECSALTSHFQLFTANTTSSSTAAQRICTASLYDIVVQVDSLPRVSIHWFSLNLYTSVYCRFAALYHSWLICLLHKSRSRNDLSLHSRVQLANLRCSCQVHTLASACQMITTNNTLGFETSRSYTL
jgi:hypothetical protein